MPKYVPSVYAMQYAANPQTPSKTVARIANNHNTQDTAPRNVALFRLHFAIAEI